MLLRLVALASGLWPVAVEAALRFADLPVFVLPPATQTRSSHPSLSFRRLSTY